MRDGDAALEVVASIFLFGGMLNEELEVDEEEDESSACAPYLARQMSCLDARTPGV